MNSPRTGVTLSDSLDALRAALRTLESEIRRPPGSPDLRFPNLLATIRDLEGTKRTKPPTNTTAYVDQWNEFLAGRRSNLDSRAIRSLCWNSDVSTTGTFHDFLRVSK